MEKEERGSKPGTAEHGGPQMPPAAAPPDGGPVVPQTRGMIGTVEEWQKQAGDYIDHAVDVTRDRIARYREAGVGQAKNTVVEYTRERPVAALLMATGAGLVLGMLMALVRR